MTYKILMFSFKRDINKPIYISANVIGGLGNQLFQIFTTIAYGIEHNRKIIFPYNKYGTEGCTNRPTYWSPDSFLCNLFLFTTEFAPNQYTNEMLRSFPVYTDEKFEYKKIPHFGEEHVYLSGYFQSYKYFHEKLPNILGLMRFSQIRDKVLAEFPSYISNTGSSENIHICMHFRYGDYKNLPNHHPILPYEYYETALDDAIDTWNTNNETKRKKKRLLYFCEYEDIAIIENHIRRLKSRFENENIEYIRVGEEVEDWKQMVLMTACDAHIIANSTFSWWGAYLSDKSKPSIVYYPSKWFGRAYNEHDTKDLFPPEWFRIDIHYI